MADECALKVVELSAGKVTTLAETPLGLRHGPMSSVDGQTLFVAFLSSEARRRGYELDLLREIDRKRLGRVRAVVTAGDGRRRVVAGGLLLVAGRSARFTDHYRPVLDVMLGQLIGLFASMRSGLKPDQPSPTGTITRSWFSRSSCIPRNRRDRTPYSAAGWPAAVAEPDRLQVPRQRHHPGAGRCGCRSRHHLLAVGRPAPPRPSAQAAGEGQPACRRYRLAPGPLPHPGRGGVHQALAAGRRAGAERGPAPARQRLGADEGDGRRVLGLPGLIPVTGAVDSELGYRALGHLDPHHLPRVPRLSFAVPALLELEDEPGCRRVGAPAGHGAGAGVALLALRDQVLRARGLDPPGRHGQVEEHVRPEQPFGTSPVSRKRIIFPVSTSIWLASTSGTARQAGRRRRLEVLPDDAHHLVERAGRTELDELGSRDNERQMTGRTVVGVPGGEDLVRRSA